MHIVVAKTLNWLTTQHTHTHTPEYSTTNVGVPQMNESILKPLEIRSILNENKKYCMSSMTLFDS